MIPIAYGRTAALGGATGNKGGIDPRLKPAAHEFEASMMQELLKPMEKDPLFSSGNGGGAGLASVDGGTSGWSSLGAESLAKAISEAGGLGLATKIIQEVEAEAKQAQGAARSGKAAGSGAPGSEKSGNGQEIRPAAGENLQSLSGVRRLP